MNARQFNKTYPVGTIFKYRNSAKMVKTVAPANDLSCGAVVEINVIPYFVSITRLTPAG
jgi:hypothetical protein